MRHCQVSRMKSHYTIVIAVFVIEHEARNIQMISKQRIVIQNYHLYETAEKY